MKTKYKPYLLFLPLLLLYVFIIIFFKPDEYVGDESRYIMFAHNLLNGYFSPPPPEINLWNGPGYPALIAIPLFFNLPEIIMRLMNALWLYLAVVLSYNTLLYVTNKKSSLVLSLFLSLYYPVYTFLPLILTETFTLFLTALISYIFVKLGRKIHLYPVQYLQLSISLAILVYTKVIFAYVVPVILFIILILYIKNRSPFYKNYMIIFSLTMLFLLPYTYYTYTLTRQVYYWSNAGSLSLYTMSTPYADENGAFMTPIYLVNSPNHKKEADSIINKMTAIPMDQSLKKIALQNIKKHPDKFLKNWIANLGRLFINYPQFNQKLTIKVIIKALPGLIILLLLFISFYIRIKHKIILPESILILCRFFFIYLTFSSLFSAYLRMFFITIPFWLIFIGYILNNVTAQVKTGK